MSDEGKRVWREGVDFLWNTQGTGENPPGAPERVVDASELDRLEARERDRRHDQLRKWQEKVEWQEKRAEAAEDHCAELWDRTQAAEARVRELEKHIQDFAAYTQRWAKARLDDALNPPAEDEQHWPDEPLMHPPPKRVQKLRVHLKPADEERHKDD